MCLWCAPLCGPAPALTTPSQAAWVWVAWMPLRLPSPSCGPAAVATHLPSTARTLRWVLVLNSELCTGSLCTGLFLCRCFESCSRPAHSPCTASPPCCAVLRCVALYLLVLQAFISFNFHTLVQGQYPLCHGLLGGWPLTALCAKAGVVVEPGPGGMLSLQGVASAGPGTLVAPVSVSRG